ncbi:MAG: sulfite exporter TauE/SafE family protein [Proteobacteria bacterium]|nr:sulfite exporter TauE/SafE family protein [Pseudomonadota bacterium]MBU1610406.1 sulfite exporter TauE/SafE family protein [Pseudomonadota bacterium]
MFGYAAIAATFAFAGLVQGITGFGSVLVALPLLSLLLPVKTAIPLASLMALVINITLTVYLWKHIHWKRALILLAATVPGIPLGLWALKVGDVSWLQAVIGVVLLAFCLHGFFAKGFKRPPGNFWAVIAGFSCGFLSAAIAAGGPPVVVYASSQKWSKDEIKALMSGYFMVTNIIVVVGYTLRELITLDIFTHFIISVPTLFLAIWLGQTLYSRLSGQDYRKVVMVMVLILGVVMLYRSLA